MTEELIVIGGGLAGTEAAWQAAEAGIQVVLYEMRPQRTTPAHITSNLAELVCSNSLGSDLPDRAPGLLKNQQVGKRRAVYLRWQDGEHASFLVLSEHQGVREGGSLRLDSVGIHHFSLWVDEIKPIYEKLQAAGVKFMVPLTETDTGGYGEAAGRVILTTIFADPDGTMVQLDQRT